MTQKRRQQPIDPIEKAQHALEELKETIREAHAANKDLVKLNNQIIAFVQSDVFDIIVQNIRDFSEQAVMNAVRAMIGDVKKNVAILKQGAEQRMMKTFAMLQGTDQQQKVMAVNILMEGDTFESEPNEDGDYFRVHVLHEHVSQDGARRFAFGNERDSQEVRSNPLFRKALEDAIEEHYPDFGKMEYGNFGNLQDDLRKQQ